ncbi:hypothetical protein [Micromonospora sp. KC721]|uniref:hypothetical protein n=1 Tax=Micromonospora sp. KC721 TaxID=2530380 RepID=UPI00104928D2|nr:hypothetical protein [Micromonospora sp. KC721]TDB82491.1 hypothetical protein E1182_01550 [Micromonospora sp. KC721]
MNVLGVELRRSAAPGAALIMLVIAVAALYVAPGRWASGWMSLAMTAREYTLLLWPLALAAGAWQGRREHRAKVGELFATTPRPRGQRMAPVLGAMAVALAAGYLLAILAGAAWIITTARYFPVVNFTVVTAVGVLSLIGAAWLGLGIGRLLPALATAPALGVAGVLLTMFGLQIRPDWLAAVLSPIYGTSQHHAFQTIDNRVSGAHAIWMAALAVAGVVLVVAGGWRVRTAALLPVLLGVTAASAVVPRDTAALDTPIDPVARQLVCTDDAPKVCVSRVNAHVLAALTPLARDGLARLARLPGAPSAVHEDTRTYDAGTPQPPRRDDVVRIPVRTDDHGGLAHPGAVVPEIVAGLGVESDRDCRDRDPVVERAAAYWLLGQEPRSDVGVIPGALFEDPALNAEAVQLWQGLRQLPEDEALARVTAVHRAVRACADSAGLLSRSAR